MQELIRGQKLIKFDSESRLRWPRSATICCAQATTVDVPASCNLPLREVGTLRFLHKHGADEDGQARNDHWIPQAVVDASGGRDDRERGHGEEAAKPAIADVIRQRH